MTKKDSLETFLVHAGRNPDEYFGIVNPPVAHASTILYPSLDAYEDPAHPYRYGRMRTPLAQKFEEAMAELEGGYDAVAAPSGYSAITTALLAFLKAGDHLLITDSLYPSTVAFCNKILKRFGVEVEYYDPLIGSDIAGLIKDNTRVIYMESPGSATFEVQDIPAIVKVAKEHDIITMADNSWAAGLLFRPIDHGVNIVIQSASKYFSGHADVMLGAMVADNKSNYNKLRAAATDLGVCAGSDALYLALRGLRTLKVRMDQAEKNTARMVEYFKGCKAIDKIYYPALPVHPGHDVWKRDFSGANGLVSLLLKPATRQSLGRFLDSLDMIPIGSSWGGYESLVQPQNLGPLRQACPWQEKGPLLRFHIGLENPDDLMRSFDKAWPELDEQL